MAKRISAGTGHESLEGKPTVQVSPPSPYLTMREAAARCRYSYEYFRKIPPEQGPPALGRGRRGARILFAQSAVDKWLANRWVGAGRV